MRNITELTILLRERVELPGGFELATEEFREGWNFAPAVNAQQLEIKVQKRGWNIIKIAEGLQACGVGDTSQEAIAGALKVALRNIGQHFNAVEIEHIELIQYPWFFLARVGVCPYRIQQGAAMPAAGDTGDLPIVRPHRCLPSQSSASYPQFGSAMPVVSTTVL